MKTDNIITDQEIKAIDLYLTDRESIFADISIDYPYVYYSIGTEDTREDGRVNLSPTLRNLIFEAISQPVNEDSSNSNDIIIRLRVVTFDGQDITFDKGTLKYAKEIISLLSESYDEFLFLDNFKQMM